MESRCCPNSAIVASIISHVAQTDSYFGGEQRGSGGLTQEEKESFLHSVLHQSAATFLTRYGTKLTEIHMEYFTENFSDDQDLMYQVALIRKEQRAAKQRVKNRRFTAMKCLLADGEYFSDEQMKHRDPLLYEQMVGQYLTDDEIKSQTDVLLRQHTGFSSMLLEQMDSKDNRELYDRQLSHQECQHEEEDSDEDEYDDSLADKAEGATELPAKERLAMREEFLHLMQERFLSGQDKDFDYTAVDEDCKYDDLVQEGRDAEEKYFEDMDDNDIPCNEVSPLAADEYDY